MDNSYAYNDLNFSLPNRRISPRIVTIAIAFVSFTIMWWLIPASISYWFVTPIFILLTWMASYGWRQAVSESIKFLKFIETL